ncbi:hypothetical protein [Cryptosporangium minutisporangium]|uniref:Uncharacterized protein n=1 Tax=Cryptosporangium minutisporangium TaxID=113569 RepID=A0ABP6SYJ8_9ACTN
MITNNRLSVKDLLIDDGFAPEWVSTYAAIVSRIYYHDVMKGVGMRKDAQGAVYGQSHASGLLQVARGLRDNPNGVARAQSEKAACQNDKCAMWMTVHGGPCD